MNIFTKLDFTRLVDFVLSAIFISWVLPLWIIVIPVLMVTGEGEVFYRQPRVGKNGKLFNLLKFTTMLKNSPNMGTGELTLHNDPRVLPVGRWLRKSKINELPQLVNVLLGHMSIVGPRPQTPRYFEKFPKDYQCELIKVRPGLSGIGSILFRDEEKMSQHAADPVAMDLGLIPYKAQVEKWYIDHRGVKNYFLVIIATIWIILFPRSQIAWKWFKGLPVPPAEIAAYCNWRG